MLVLPWPPGKIAGITSEQHQVLKTGLQLFQGSCDKSTRRLRFQPCPSVFHTSLYETGQFGRLPQGNSNQTGLPATGDLNSMALSKKLYFPSTGPLLGPPKAILQCHSSIGDSMVYSAACLGFHRSASKCQFWCATLSRLWAPRIPRCTHGRMAPEILHSTGCAFLWLTACGIHLLSWDKPCRQPPGSQSAATFVKNCDASCLSSFVEQLTSEFQFPREQHRSGICPTISLVGCKCNVSFSLKGLVIQEGSPEILP